LDHFLFGKDQLGVIYNHGDKKGTKLTLKKEANLYQSGGKMFLSNIGGIGGGGEGGKQHGAVPVEGSTIGALMYWLFFPGVFCDVLRGNHALHRTKWEGKE